VDNISLEIRTLDPLSTGDAQAGPAAAIEPFERVRIDLAEMDALLSGVSETEVQLDGIRREIEAVKQVENGLAGLEPALSRAGACGALLSDGAGMLWR
jgi:hypothetical protein